MPTYSGPAMLRGADPKVIAGFWAALTETRADRRLELALFSAGIVEANLKNPRSGDRDSIGSLQQRSRGWGPVESRMDPRRAALLFLKDATTRVLPRRPGAEPGVLAQLVQRSAFPARYTAAQGAAAYVITATRPGAAPDPTPGPVTPGARRVLSEGDTGPDVAVVQSVVGAGDFGPATAKAVKAYQKAHGLTADGVVGARTWAAINTDRATPTPTGGTP